MVFTIDYSIRIFGWSKPTILTRYHTAVNIALSVNIMFFRKRLLLNKNKINSNRCSKSPEYVEFWFKCPNPIAFQTPLYFVFLLNSVSSLLPLYHYLGCCEILLIWVRCLDNVWVKMYLLGLVLKTAPAVANNDFGNVTNWFSIMVPLIEYSSNRTRRSFIISIITN